MSNDHLLEAMLVLSRATEHLQGQHDQQDHAGGRGMSGKKPKHIDKSESSLGPRMQKVAKEIRATHQKSMQKKLGKEGYDKLQGQMDGWVNWSNSPGAISLEYAAQLEFGGDVRNADGIMNDQDITGALKKAKTTKSEIRQQFRAEYENTQEQLKEMYPDGYVELYRGTHNKSGKLPASGSTKIKTDAMSSWTDDESTARRFADQSSSGRVVKVRVPVSQIWSSYETNPVLTESSEGEYMVMGMGQDMQAEIVQ